jgi:DNA-binding NtrC family response regulator
LGTKPFILYVEDEPLLRELVAEVLADNDLPCVSAENGPDAIRIMEDGAYEFCLLLCDVKLPGTIDGFAVADHFEQRYPDGEVVLITAHIAPEDMPQMTKRRRQIYPKPIRMKSLVEILNDTVRPGRDQRSDASAVGST